MHPSDWQHIKRHLESLLDCAPAMRGRLADELCAGRPSWRAEIDALMGSVDDELPGFLELEDESVPALRAAPEDYWPGRVLGGYRIGRWLGSGGAGHVFEASRTKAASTAKPVAIKIFDTRDGITPARRRDLARECALQSRLADPSIVKVLDADMQGAHPYLVTELVRGLPIDAHCRAHALTIPQRLSLALRLVDAVRHAHARGVIHGDIKAANVLVTAQGAVSLIDFGIAVEAGEIGCESRADGSVAFSPESAAPEQVRREPSTVATDVYGVGALVYRLVTGHAPHRVGPQATLFDTVRAVQAGKPLRASERILRDGLGPRTGLRDAAGARKRLQEGLDDVLERALASQPARRQKDLDALRADLHRCMESAPRTLDALDGSAATRTRRGLGVRAEEPAAAAWRRRPDGSAWIAIAR